MIESEAALRRVIVEVPSTSLPELMTVLGTFAMLHDLSVDVVETYLANTEPYLAGEQRIYNPDMITWMDDQKSGGRVAVITRENLATFTSPNKGTGKYFINRLYNSLLRGQANAFGYDKDRVGDYIYTGSNIFYGGIIADKLPILIDALQNDRLLITNIGNVSIRFLADYSEALTADTNGRETIASAEV